uniref:Uncharacterized protein n=1 Tax=Kocuria rosea subsp. polaris TaxID=136273 RepID=A0A0A6VMW4_KOCRO|nr:hypothetical protein GY22_15745 [Kocuria polaris]
MADVRGRRPAARSDGSEGPGDGSAQRGAARGRGGCGTRSGGPGAVPAPKSGPRCIHRSPWAGSRGEDTRAGCRPAGRHLSGHCNEHRGESDGPDPTLPVRRPTALRPVVLGVLPRAGAAPGAPRRHRLGRRRHRLTGARGP